MFKAKDLLLKAALVGLNLFSLSAQANSNTHPSRVPRCDEVENGPRLEELSYRDFQNYLNQAVKADYYNQIQGNSPVHFIDKIIVSKFKRELYLIRGSVILKTYHIALGENPHGHKHFEGDGKTPEGLYSIDLKNKNSHYHLSLHLSYPNKQDTNMAHSMGRAPGGNIMIHGFPNDIRKSRAVGEVHPNDWTNGCIAVTNTEIQEIYSLVKVGTPIEVCAF